MDETVSNYWQTDVVEPRLPLKMADLSDAKLVSHRGHLNVYNHDSKDEQMDICFFDGNFRKCDILDVYFLEFYRARDIQPGEHPFKYCQKCASVMHKADEVSNGTCRGYLKPVCLVCIQRSKAYFFQEGPYGPQLVHCAPDIPTKPCSFDGCSHLIPDTLALTACCREHL